MRKKRYKVERGRRKISKTNSSYVELPEKAQKQAEKLMKRYEKKTKSMLDEVWDELYCEVMLHIESDVWSNYRQDVIQWIQGYDTLHKVDAKKVRQAILKNHREQIVDDLNADLLEENEKLKKQKQELLEENKELIRSY